VRSISQQFQSVPGSIPVGAIVKTGTKWAVPAAKEGCCFIFASYYRASSVGISVGIGSNRRQKIFQIQLVMVLGDSGQGHQPMLLRSFGLAGQRTANLSYSRKKT